MGDTFSLPEGDDIFPDDEDEPLAKWQRMLADTRSTDYLIEIALTTADPEEYIEAIDTLQMRATSEVLEAARDLCGSLLAHERKLGAAILSRIGDTAPILRVARRLRMSGSDQARTYANKLYAHFGPGGEEQRAYPKEALGILLPMLDNEEDIETLREVLCAVAEYQDFHPSITPRIAALRTHSKPEVRFTVTTRLALNLQNPTAQQAIIELANDEDEDVRNVAGDWLEMIDMLCKEKREEE